VAGLRLPELVHEGGHPSAQCGQALFRRDFANIGITPVFDSGCVSAEAFAQQWFVLYAVERNDPCGPLEVLGRCVHGAARVFAGCNARFA